MSGAFRLHHDVTSYRQDVTSYRLPLIKEAPCQNSYCNGYQLRNTLKKQNDVFGI